MPNLIEIENLKVYCQENAIDYRFLFLRARPNANIQDDTQIQVMLKLNNHTFRKTVLRVSDEKKAVYCGFEVSNEEAKKKIWREFNWKFISVGSEKTYFINTKIVPPLPCPLFTDQLGNQYQMVSVKDYKNWLETLGIARPSTVNIYNAVKKGVLRYTVTEPLKGAEREKLHLSNIMIIFDEKAQISFPEKYIDYRKSQLIRRKFNER